MTERERCLTERGYSLQGFYPTMLQAKREVKSLRKNGYLATTLSDRFGDSFIFSVWAKSNGKQKQEELVYAER